MVAFGSLATAPATLSQAAAASITINVPAGTANGDFLLMVVTDSNPVPWGSPSGAVPSGWTLIGNAADAGNDDNYSSAYWRTAASEPANYTVSLSSATSPMCGVIARYTGTTGLRASIFTPTTAQSSAVSTSQAPGTISGTMAATDLAIICYTYASDSSSVSPTLTSPTTGSWTNRVTFGPTTASSSFKSGLILVDKLAGTDTPTASASSAGGWAIFSLALINAPTKSHALQVKSFAAVQRASAY